MKCDSNFDALNSKTATPFPQDLLLQWYDSEKRDLPWRESLDPYRIWLSEIILQQTRVDQGMPYYERFLETFPTVVSLAEASEDMVLKLWEGLGYYSRARNLHATAKYVSKELNGQFPNTHSGLLKLKGVGPYTAAAIGSIAFNLPVAAVDGNVYRVLARYFGIAESIDENNGKNQISDIAQSILNTKRPGDHNQALMEMGATVCTPKQPDCTCCPLRVNCMASIRNMQLELPVRTKKTKVRNRFFYYLLRVVDGNVLIQRRGEGDIWHGLYEFPVTELGKRLSEKDLISALDIQSDDVVISISKEYKHVLSHQRIFARFVVVRRQSVPNAAGTWISIADLRKFAFPRLINRYLERTNFVIEAEVSNI